MALAAKRTAREAPTPTAPLTIADIVLARIAAGGATRAELQRDLAPVLAPKVTGTAFRRAAEAAIGTFAGQGLISETKGRLTTTAQGTRAAEAVVSAAKSTKGGWPGVHDALVLRALGCASDSSATARALDRADSFACLLLQQHFGLTGGKVLSMPDLRSELAVVALERAFGNKIKTGLRKGAGLPAKAGRLLAGQLFKSPREFSTDGKLILALAAEVAGTNDASLEGLKSAALQRLLETADAELQRLRPAPAKARTPAPGPSAPSPANDAAPLGRERAAAPRQRISPDMGEFAGAVLDAARPVSEGWPGNRKAFISRVWRAIRDTRPDWELSEIAFKSMLAEAHRTGAVVLAGADLKDKCDLAELDNSKIVYKNAVWHFVRVED